MENQEIKTLTYKAWELLAEIKRANCLLPVSVHEKLEALSHVLAPLIDKAGKDH